MRILQIETVNGVGRTYATGLERRGHVSLVFEPSLAGAGAPLPLKLLRMPGRLLNMLGVAGRMRASYCDVVHIQWASYGVLGLLSRVPFVVQCHGSDVRDRLRRPLFRLLLGPVFRRAGAVLCVTPDLLPVVRSLRPDAQWIPAAIDTTLFAPRPPEEGPWTILLLARLDPIKGVDIAVDALERFTARHPETRVILVDSGPLATSYRERFDGRFHFVPWMRREDVPALIQAADVVVGQFTIGALGLSELQAMSCARPVIAYIESGLYPSPPPLYNAATVAETLAHLEALYTDPSHGADTARKGREWACEHYSCDVLAARLERLYAGLIDQQDANSR
jgi:glycosyltransferase involved in cell wall biosynthesis